MNSHFKDVFIDVGKFQMPKTSMRICGDHMISKKFEGGNRVISILSDGLGSGVKASVLSTLCSSMFMQFASNDIDVEHSVKLIMEILPICQVRKIAYSTFTIVDINLFGKCKIIEFDNPHCCVIRNGKVEELNRVSHKIKLSNGRDSVVKISEFEVQNGDRIVSMSDGVSQSGIGIKYALGWRERDYQSFLLECVKANEDISSKQLAKKLVIQAANNDNQLPHDDISCGVIYLRRPRKALVLTGPPIKEGSDRELADMANSFKGVKIICGGTTASIVARELNKTIELNVDLLSKGVPPTSKIDGFDLVTEGIITLNKTLDFLMSPDDEVETELSSLLLASDDITFVVGTRINNAHYVPGITYEFEIRRTIVKKISELLKNNHFKRVSVSYI